MSAPSKAGNPTILLLKGGIWTFRDVELSIPDGENSTKGDKRPVLSDAYAIRFLESGFNPITLPVLHLEAVENDLLLLNDRQSADDAEAIVVTSASSLHSLRIMNAKLRDDIMRFPVYAVGNSSAEACVEFGFDPSNVIVQPAKQKDGAGLAEFIASTWDSRKKKRILFFCGNIRRDELPNKLKEEGFEVREICLYRTKERVVDLANCVQDLIQQKGKEIWIAFFSPSGVNSFLLSGFLLEKSTASMRFAAIGKTTAEALHKANLPVHAIAENPSPEGLLKAITSYNLILGNSE